MIYRDISHVNWSAMESPEDDVEVLGLEGSFLVPQLISFIASQMPLAYTAEGKVSFLETLNLSIEKAKAGNMKFPTGRACTALELRGILSYLAHAPRGEVLGKGNKQISPQIVRYATGVPLVLSAFKEFKDIPYSQWDWDAPITSATYLLVDKDIAELIPFFGKESGWTLKELLQFRVEGSTVGSGPNMGKVKPPNQVTSITGVKDPSFRALPKLAKLILCQTWVYQPSIRSKYAITNLENIDELAEDITGGITDLFSSDTPAKRKIDTSDIKWE